MLRTAVVMVRLSPGRAADRTGPRPRRPGVRDTPAADTQAVGSHWYAEQREPHSPILIIGGQTAEQCQPQRVLAVIGERLPPQMEARGWQECAKLASADDGSTVRGHDSGQAAVTSACTAPG